MNRWVACPQLGGASVSVHRPKTPSEGEPHLDVGKEPYTGDMREVELPPFHLPLTGGRRSKRGLHPSPFHYPFGGALISLLPLLHFLTGGMSHLPPYDIRGRVGIPRLIVATPKTLHKIASTMKR
jgi:hypothetical protein